MLRLKGILGVRKSALIRPQHVGAAAAVISSQGGLSGNFMVLNVIMVRQQGQVEYAKHVKLEATTKTQDL